MNQKETQDSTIKKKYENIIYDEVSFGIITSLRFNEPLNLKNLAQLIGRPETTTIRYLKQLLEDKLIDIDAEKTASSWGKFYHLSDPVKKIVEQNERESQQQENQIFSELANYKNMSEEKLLQIFLREITSKEISDEVKMRLKGETNLSYNIQKMIINSFINASNRFKKVQEEKGVDYLKKNFIMDPGDINTTTIFVKYSKVKHVLALIEKFLEFHKGIKELQSEFKQEMDKEGIPDDDRKTHYIGLFMGTTDFDFRLKQE